MAGWKKKLNRELEELVRAVPSEFAPEKRSLPAVRKQKRILRITAMATACILLFGGLLAVLLQEGSGQNTGNVILMEAESAIRLYTDASGTVSGIFSENENGDILLSDGEFTGSLYGIPAENAVQKLAERAFAAGFVREEESAVRFTVAGDIKSSAKNLLETLENSVVGYFCQKGVFVPVLGRIAELKDFGTAETVAVLFQQTYGDPVTLVERKASLSRPEDVASEYRNDLLHYTEKIVEYVYRTASGKKSALKEIDALNVQITNHPDNTFSLPYWFLRETYGTAEKLEELSKRMEILLSDFKSRYGQTLEGTEHYVLFLALNSYYENLDLSSLRRSMDEFLSFVKYFTGIFDPSALIGLISGDDALEQIVSALFDGIGILPETAEDYVRSALDMLEREAKLMLYEHRAETEKQRPSLSVEEYRSKMEEIFDRFENFEEFWDYFQ